MCVLVDVLYIIRMGPRLPTIHHCISTPPPRSPVCTVHAHCQQRPRGSHHMHNRCRLNVRQCEQRMPGWLLPREDCREGRCLLRYVAPYKQALKASIRPNYLIWVMYDFLFLNWSDEALSKNNLYDSLKLGQDNENENPTRISKNSTRF